MVIVHAHNCQATGGAALSRKLIVMTTGIVRTDFARRAGAFALGAGLCACLAATSASAAPADPSDETRAMILGPLQTELSGPAPYTYRNPARGDANPFALQYQARPPQMNLAGSRPAAARFAEAALTSQADGFARDGLAAFSGQEAVLATSPSGARLSVSMFEVGRPDIARLTYDPAYAETAGSALAPGMDMETRRMALNVEGAFDAHGGGDRLDIGLSPRAGVSFGQDGAAAAAGATVRLGQYLDNYADGRPAWWLFAGADRQAVMYDPGRGFDVRDALAMEPYALVGDAQAGVAMRVRGADVSLAYIHRETRYALPQQSWETSEGFAAFSLTWKR